MAAVVVVLGVVMLVVEKSVVLCKIVVVMPVRRQ